MGAVCTINHMRVWKSKFSTDVAVVSTSLPQVGLAPTELAPDEEGAAAGAEEPAGDYNEPEPEEEVRWR